MKLELWCQHECLHNWILVKSASYFGGPGLFLSMAASYTDLRGLVGKYWDSILKYSMISSFQRNVSPKHLCPPTTPRDIPAQKTNIIVVEKASLNNQWINHELSERLWACNTEHVLFVYLKEIYHNMKQPTTKFLLYIQYVHQQS